MMMKKYTLRILVTFVMTSWGLSVKGQVTTAQQEIQDSTLNVIAYFCKNDTLGYHYEDYKAKIYGNDTIVEHYHQNDFLLTVRDSTSEGYEIECIPQEALFDFGKDTLMTNLMQSLYDRMGDMHVIFTIDEYGSLKHIKNWLEIKKFVRQVAKNYCDTLYSRRPEINDVLPRVRLETRVNLLFDNEKDYMANDDEMQLLFGCFGKSLKLGKSEMDDRSDQGFPEHIEAVAGYGKSSEEQGFDDDYFIRVMTTTNIPKEEVRAYVSNYVGMYMSDKVADKVHQKLEEQDYTDALVTVGETYDFFYNGWPADVEHVKSTEVNGVKDVEIKTVSWTKRTWGVFGGSSDSVSSTDL